MKRLARSLAWHPLGAAVSLLGQHTALHARRTCGTSSGGEGISGKGFRSAVRFRLSPGEVTAANVPSAREVADMLPSVSELHAQLPDARELERRYVRADAAQSGAKPEPSTAASGDGEEGEFENTSEMLGDLLDTQANGADAAPVKPEHVLLAYRALAWGTVYAIMGVGVVVVVCMWACGYSSVAAVLAGVRAKADREEARLHDRASRAAAADGITVRYYKMDLSNPVEAFRQATEIWLTIRSLVAEETAKPASS